MDHRRGVASRWWLYGSMTTHGEISLIGAGGFAAEIIEAVEAADWRVSGLFDDSPSALNREVLGHRCVGTVSEFENLSPSFFLIAVGDNR